MKKILFLLLTVVTVCSCYNDDDLWDKVNDLDGRIETLETTVKKMNSEITTLQSLVDALNQGMEAPYLSKMERMVQMLL